LSDFRKKALRAAGYAGFFLFVFVAAFYFTFEAGILVPLAQKEARRHKIMLKIENASLKGLFGLDLSRVEVRPLNSRPTEVSYFVMDRLTVSPSLGSLISAARAARSGKPGPMQASFTARIGPGTIEGEFKQYPPSLEVPLLKVDKLPLSRLPIRAKGASGLSIEGSVNARVENLYIKDARQPDTWSGEVQLDVIQPRVSDFNFSGVDVAGLEMEFGTLKAEIKDGNVKIGAVKLEGVDIPMNLQGTISLKRPLGRSVVKLDGTITASDEYKKKNPILSAMLSQNGSYSFNGTLDMLIPGL